MKYIIKLKITKGRNVRLVGLWCWHDL